MKIEKPLWFLPLWKVTEGLESCLEGSPTLINVIMILNHNDGNDDGDDDGDDDGNDGLHLWEGKAVVAASLRVGEFR